MKAVLQYDPARAARELLDRGGKGRAQIVQELVGYGISEHEAAAITEDAIRERLSQQPFWGETDLERLRHAGRQLQDGHQIRLYERLGANHEEAADLVHRRMRTDGSRGFIFYAESDIDIALLEGCLLLSYGTSSEQHDDGLWEHETLQVGRLVVRTLRASGLEASWQEDIDQRIEVNFEWKERWLGQARPVN